MELHPDNVNEETLANLRAAGVTKISIGIQSFGDKFLSILGRKSFKPEQIAAALQKVPFDTVSMDYIFALPNQIFEDLKSDMESFTDSTVRIMEKREKRKLLDDITLYCQSKGYTRDSIWTFSNVPEAKYSSMTRENFLGFGCSATTLLRNQFKINTFSVGDYQERIAENNLPTSLTLRFTKRQRMIYYLFWTAYSTQVDGNAFETFFEVKLQKYYGFEVWITKKLGYITEENGILHMTLKGAFFYHYYENFYTLSYIDKMWSVLRNHAFPEEIRL